MKFSLRLNNDLTIPQYIALAQAAEAVGFDQFWVSNDLFLRSGSVIAAALLQATDRMEIGIGILNPYTINPAEIAMLASTLDELSGNRFNLGFAAMRESVQAIRALQQGEAVTLDGEFLQWTPEAYLRFEAPRMTPIYIGAMGPKMLALAGEIGDGVLPLLFPPEHYFGVEPYLESGVAKRDPSLDALDFAACIWVSLDNDAEAARHVLAEKIAYYGPSLSPLILKRLGLEQTDFASIEAAMLARDEARAAALVDERMLQIGVVGQPNDVIARLEPLVEAGASHLSFGPPLGPEPLEAVMLLGQEGQQYDFREIKVELDHHPRLTPRNSHFASIVFTA